jgi:hypothetical protein
MLRDLDRRRIGRGYQQDATHPGQPRPAQRGQGAERQQKHQIREDLDERLRAVAAYLRHEIHKRRQADTLHPVQRGQRHPGPRRRAQDDPGHQRARPPVPVCAPAGRHEDDEYAQRHGRQRRAQHQPPPVDQIPDQVGKHARRPGRCE